MYIHALPKYDWFSLSFSLSRCNMTCIILYHLNMFEIITSHLIENILIYSIKSGI